MDAKSVLMACGLGVALLASGCGKASNDKDVFNAFAAIKSDDAASQTQQLKALDARYKGKSFLISGIVHSAAADTPDGPSILLNPVLNNEKWMASIFFDAKHKATVEKFKKGQQVVCRCTFESGKHYKDGGDWVLWIQFDSGEVQ